MASEKVIIKSSDVLIRHMAGGTWASRKIEKQGKRSVTPGRKKRADTCQLTPIAGAPRKHWSRARSYKDKNYGKYCEFVDTVNR